MTEVVRQGVTALRASPLRSALGALAIAVAVATIVVVIAALDGIRRYAEVTTARTFGANAFLIGQVAAPGRVSRRQLQEQLARNPPITRADAAALARYGASTTRYAPNAQVRADVAQGAALLEDAPVTGTTSALAEIRDLNLILGRFIAPEEDVSGAHVAVIGADVADRLFAGREPLGHSIRIAGRRFQVIGVQGRIGGGLQDKYVWMPLRAHERAFGATRSLQIFATGVGNTTARTAEDHARTSMRAIRALAPGAPDNFDVLTPDAARGFVANLSQRIGAAALPIALIALLAAIVVVTNTVLVSVTQRTREIGIRRALGARKSQVVAEVLAEAALLGALGGAAGTLLALAILGSASAVLPVEVSAAPTTLALAIVAAAGSGVAAGWYPAVRANRLDVIEALRSE
jgi:putative ABC transport system permease protein